MKKAFIKIFAIFTRKLQTCNLNTDVFQTPTQMFTSEYCKIFKSTYFEEHLPTAAFFFLTAVSSYFWLDNLLTGYE